MGSNPSRSVTTSRLGNAVGPLQMTTNGYTINNKEETKHSRMTTELRWTREGGDDGKMRDVNKMDKKDNKEGDKNRDDKGKYIRKLWHG